MVVLALLRKFNYDILTATNGLEALEMFKSDKFDCILMDIHMPKMDGITSTKLIREFEKENNLDETPILALTASHPEEDKSKCLDAGMNDFIRKPVRQEELSRIISIFVDTNTSEK
jgi:CheY-like chemotaxis protein